MTPDTLVLTLMRLEFALTASFHYLFVPLTLGLVLALALMEAAHVGGGRAVWRDAARFWRRFFVLAWLVGMATGYPLRWQLQAQWQGYSLQVREVLEAVMRLEAGIAPLMLSLVAVLSLAGHKLGARVRLTLSVLLVLAMAAQAAGILTLNAWMQHPVGVRFSADGAQLRSLAAVFANPYAHTKIAHTLSAAVVTGAFFMLAGSGWYLLRRRHLEVARASMRVALPMALAGMLATLWSGHESALDVARHQPMKFAAMEAHWHTGDEAAALVLWGRPDVNGRRNVQPLELPKAMGWLAGGEGGSPAGIDQLLEQSRARLRAAVQPGAPAALAGWRSLYEQTARRQGDAWARLAPEQRIEVAAQASLPHVPSLFVAFRLMVGIGLLLLALLCLAWWRRGRLESGLAGRRTLGLLVCCLPLPWVATLAGWAVAEMGRQPWVVYGQLPTSAAAVLPTLASGIGEIVAFMAAYGLLGLAFVAGCWWLLARGPQRQPLWTLLRRRPGSAGWAGCTTTVMQP
ncbi:cytochrome ubiquinol oxidase subunit I [Methylibium rhizosphaerae]|uniref:cytochrome ubiquinol oxidase subunit I n=1 Tax=Methylibium rhizosphaerae TaxID=2570323 RepID=UPI00112A82C9|nr:cytochrome ubiquinol oxidase subunit I [Methylibium rhizosphaerae]